MRSLVSFCFFSVSFAAFSAASFVAFSAASFAAASADELDVVDDNQSQAFIAFQTAGAGADGVDV